MVQKVLRLASLSGMLLGLARSIPAEDTHFDFAAIQAAAARGDATAEYELGRCYEKGRGVPSDFARAVACMRQAAEQGNAAAQGQLGYYYGQGLGVPRDPVAAFQWYEKAALQGNAVAEFGLGYIYSRGRGVAPDPALAVQWWQKAADHKLAAAQNALGQFYFQSARTNRSDYAKAFAWLEKRFRRGRQLVPPGRPAGERGRPVQSRTALSGWAGGAQGCSAGLCLVQTKRRRRQRYRPEICL